jgi:hypothetical protein
MYLSNSQQVIKFSIHKKQVKNYVQVIIELKKENPKA